MFNTYILNLINILLESDEDSHLILSANKNSCGIGIIVEEDYFLMVLLISYLPIKIISIQKNLLGNLEITGKVVEPNNGLYAIKIIDLETKKEKYLINYQFIKFDLESQKFEAIFELQEEL